MSFYGELAETAATLLAEFGAMAYLRRAGTPEYDPATGTTTGAVSVDEPVIACVFDYEEEVIDDTLIQRGDKQAFISVLPTLAEPKAGDAFIWLSEQYTIVKHKELAPSGINVLFEWQVRK